MKFILKIFISLLIVSTSLIPGLVIAETIKIATGEYPPYSSEASFQNGFALDVMREAFKRVELDTEFVFLPWARAYKETNEGKYHGTGAWAFKAERENEFFHSEPVYQARTVFYRLRSYPIREWNKLSDLGRYSIGATQEYTYTKEFWDLPNVQNARLDELNIKKLLRSRIKLFPLNEVVGNELLNQNFTAAERDRLTTLKKPLVEFPVSLLFPKKLESSENLMSAFNKGLRLINEDGTYQKMYSALLAGKYSI